MQERAIHPIHIFALGCTALCAQSVFVRESLALFTGTELVVGALLASWLLWVGAGALAGGRAILRRGAAGAGTFRALAVAAAVLVPLTVLGIRLARALIVRPPGALAPFGPALAASFLVVAPFGFLYGCLYNVASVLWRSGAGGIREGISRVYFWEAAGSVFGAFLFSFFLVSYFSQLEAALVAGILLIFAAVLLPPRAEGRGRRLVLLFAIVFLSSAAAPSLDRRSIGRVFPGYRIARFYSSRFGEIVVADRAEMRSVFSGGGRLYSYPEPERAQETVHIPLLLHPEPRSVLLVGGSLGGGWQEAVKHPSVSVVDCVELDGSLFEIGGASRDTIIERNAVSTEATAAASAGRDTMTARNAGSFGAPAAAPATRVRFIAADGRFLLARGDTRYDVIVVAAPAPVNLQWNRFFTEEFFAIAARSLAPGGVLAIGHPSSENFLSNEAARALRCVELSMRAVFPRVSALPGATALFVGGERAADPSLIERRLEERRIEAPFVSSDYLPFRFSRERLEEFRANLDRAGDLRRNRDGRPVLPLYELALEGKRADAAFAGFVGALAKAWPPGPALVLIAALAALFAAAGAALRPRLAVWAVGFGSFLLQILILLAFQSFSGLLYHAIVLLTALFMAGAAVGAHISLRNARWGRGALRWIHLCFIALAAALAGAAALGSMLTVSYGAGAIVFMCFAAAGGALTGAYYPIVVREAFPEGAGAVPATFYAWDLFGACAAGAAGGIVVFPLIGLAGTALLVALVHALAAALLAGRRWT